MEVSDVPDPANTPPTPKRCTTHVIRGSTAFGTTLIHGNLVRIAAADWPPDVLFNSTYAALVLEIFGVKKAISEMLEAWKDELPFAQPNELETQKAAYDARRRRQKDEHDRRNVQEPDGLDMMSMTRYLASPLGIRGEMAARRRQQEISEQREVEVKVTEWLACNQPP